MSVTIGGRLSAPPVFLAPMAGITDLPFRRAVLRHGPALVVSEMIASREVLAAGRSARMRAELGLGGADTGIQIAGNDPVLMAEAARYCAGEGAALIDINFGCPAKKVTNAWSGAALMRTRDLALSIVDAVVRAVDLPVTVKMRLGWDDTVRNAPDIAHGAEEAGAALVTVHGRTRCKFYSGTADWGAIREVTDAVTVPVIANGDITDAQSARAALRASGAQGVMIGRGAQGQPWLLSRIAAALSGRKAQAAPSASDTVAHILQHYEDMLSFYGPALGVRVARKHLGWYLERLEGAAPLRARVLRLTDPRSVIRELEAGIPCCNSSSLQAVA
ncbi:MAG: tRNA dihydrouridine synthase DusB [Pseudomonadota bacterium]